MAAPKCRRIEGRQSPGWRVFPCGNGQMSTPHSTNIFTWWDHSSVVNRNVKILRLYANHTWLLCCLKWKPRDSYIYHIESLGRKLCTMICQCGVFIRYVIPLLIDSLLCGQQRNILWGEWMGALSKEVVGEKRNVYTSRLVFHSDCSFQVVNIQPFTRPSQ